MSHALKDILELSGRPPDWIVKCMTSIDGSQVLLAPIIDTRIPFDQQFHLMNQRVVILS
jgi:hypothetical protein